MPLLDIPGQRRAHEILQGGVARGQVHHAYLFGGPEGAGKERAARLFIQALNCETQAELERVPCGACGECQRIAAGNHPDVAWVMPEMELIRRKLAGRADFADSPSREVKIGQVRKLTERLSLKALSARRKAGALLFAERMNPAAQNALLKTLEEPPADTVIVLVSSAPDVLLPTIRSRCLRVPFVPLPLDEVARQVAKERGLGPAEAMLCARLAQGSLARALELDAARLGERARLFEQVERLDPADARPALRLAESLAADRDGAEWALAMLKLWLRDQLALLSGSGDAGLVNMDLLEPMRRAAMQQPAARLLRRIDEVEQALAAIQHHASPRMQLERLFLRYAP